MALVRMITEVEVKSRDWLLVSEHFTAPQGEGPNMGRPAYWTRLGGCGLFCSWCDSAHTWCYDERHVKVHDAHHKYDPRVELHRETIPALIDLLLDQPLNHYAITGGEPLLQRSPVSRVISGVNEEAYYAVSFEIETAGVVSPGELATYSNVSFNVSPKLASSGNPLELRRKLSVLREFVPLAGCFKFVIDTRKPDYSDDIREVHELIDLVEIPHRRVWLMPCGDTLEEVVNGMRLLEPLVVKFDWNLSSRLHVLMHGNERGF